MTKKWAVVVFVKTPKLGQVKTRLAESIGLEASVAIYRFLLAVCSEQLIRLKELDTEVDCLWAVNEQEALHYPFWQANGHGVIWQREGGLADKLSYIDQTLKQQYAVISFLGADCPWLTAEHLLQGYQNLDKHSSYWMPARDGGFTLVSWKTSDSVINWGKGVYSHRNTLDSLLASLVRSDYVIGETFDDIDVIGDLVRWKDSLESKVTKTRVETQALNYIQTNNLVGE
jgi:glycosyltransferase A (GT-A) superfamily protein (DUF2064 family)